MGIKKCSFIKICPCLYTFKPAFTGFFNCIIRRFLIPLLCCSLLLTDNLTESDLVNYAETIRDKVRENELVMKQIANNSPDQALLGDFSKAVDDAIIDSNEAHKDQMMQLLSDAAKAKAFAKVVFDMLQEK